MLNKKLIKKIHEDLEGKTDAAGQQELSEQLARDPEAAAYFKDWQKIRSTIDIIKEQTPQIQFAQEIINSINPGVSPVTWFRSKLRLSHREKLNHIPMESQTHHKPEPLLRIPVWNKPEFRYSIVFIAGIFLGFLAFVIFMPGSKTTKAPAFQLKGAMYDSRNFDQMTTADVLVFENAMVKASFNVRYSNSMVEARITLSSLYPVQGVLLFDYNSLQVMNVLNVSVNDQSSISASSNFVQINNSGNNQYIVQLLNKNSLPHQISVKILQNEVPIYQNAVTVNKE